MAQQLIVEGKDGIFLANLCNKRGLPPPKNYSNPHKFKAKFIKEARGIEKVSFELKEALNKSDITNIGVIVDANEVGPEARYDMLKNIIEKELSISIPDEAKLTSTGFVYAIDGLTIGIWVMPDNIQKGYLEHFVMSLLPETNLTKDFAEEKLGELMNQSFCEVKSVHRQKALIHTYLAWQKTPGLPMGTALQANYFDGQSLSADKFIEWFGETFELEK